MGRLATKENNLFKSIIDSILYIIIYFAIPVSQLIRNIFDNTDVFWLTVFLLLLSLAYDCYTRYDTNIVNCGSKNLKIKIIGIVTVLLLVMTIFCISLLIGNVQIASWVRLCYLLLIIPFTIAIYDTVIFCIKII